MALAQLAYRCTFIDVMAAKTEGADRRTRARSLSPTRTSASPEPLMQDVWAHRHLRTLRQGRSATIVDAPVPSRGSLGHPALCNKPCVCIARQGHCQKGWACGFCHCEHEDPKPDKKQRLLMSTMPRPELLSLLADLLRERAEQDELRDVSFVLAVPRSI